MTEVFINHWIFKNNSGYFCKYGYIVGGISEQEANKKACEIIKYINSTYYNTNISYHFSKQLWSEKL